MTTTNINEIRLMNTAEARAFLAERSGDKLMTQAELAAHYGLSRAAISKLLKRPDAPKPDRDKKYKLTEIEGYRSLKGLKTPAASVPAEGSRLSVDPEMSQTEANRMIAVLKASLLSIEEGKAKGEVIETAVVAAEDKAAAAMLVSQLRQWCRSEADALAAAGIVADASAAARHMWTEMKQLIRLMADSYRRDSAARALAEEIPDD